MYVYAGLAPMYIVWVAQSVLLQRNTKHLKLNLI